MGMFIKPASGIKVRDPISKLHIPDSGVEVPSSAYWNRRLRDGDVMIASQPDDKQRKPKE